MNKIIAIALESRGFKPEVINNIIEVAEATNNSTLAIEMLLGVYEAPTIATSSILTSKADELAPRQLVKYNPFQNKVYFKVLKKQTKKFFFKSQELLDKATNWAAAEDYCTYNETEFFTTLTRERAEESWCPLNQWQN